ncbi:MAG: hypothetical protein QOG65_821 [Actinomycetota bacterium]|nr:hypothetical protein [Actinomycetota bacterium]
MLGLQVHPATAWFAIELGIPSSILGGLLGLASGAIARGFCSFMAERRYANASGSGSNECPYRRMRVRSVLPAVCER